jgi:hypothetical protein
VRLNRHVISSEKKKKGFFKVSEKKQERVVEFEGLGFQIYCVRARARARAKKTLRKGNKIAEMHCAAQQFFFFKLRVFLSFFFQAAGFGHSVLSTRGCLTASFFC